MNLISLKATLPVKHSRVPLPMLKTFNNHYHAQPREPDFGYILFYDHPKWHKPWFVAFRAIDIKISSINDFMLNPYGFAIPTLRYDTTDVKLQVIDETLGTAFPPSMQYMQDWCMSTFADSLDASLVINFNQDVAEEVFLHRVFPRQASMEFTIASGRLTECHAEFGVTRLGYYHQHEFKPKPKQLPTPRLQLR